MPRDAFFGVRAQNNGIARRLSMQGSVTRGFVPLEHSIYTHGEKIYASFAGWYEPPAANRALFIPKRVAL